jgi:peptidoglycan hydrolase CwlO-like protein
MGKTLIELKCNGFLEGGIRVFQSWKLKPILALGLVISIVVMSFCTSMVYGYAEPPSKIEEKLAGISEEEKKLLQSLFVLTQEIEIFEREEKKLALEIEAANQELKKLETEIAKEQADYARNQEALRRFFKTYQRMGPGSYLEIIMDSDSMSTFLRRLNILRDLTRNVGKLLDMLAESRDKLSDEKMKVAAQLKLIVQKQEQSKEAFAQKLKLKKEQEEYLASLNEKSKFYQEQLANIQKMLDELKPLLSQAAKEFSNIIADGGISADALKISISLFRIKGTIEEKAFNDIISKRTSLEALEFAFHTDQVVITIPEKQLQLSGKFVIQEGNILSFQPEEGSFYGMPLEVEYIEELMNESNLALDLKPLLGKNILQSIKLQEGYIELFVQPNLF